MTDVGGSELLSSDGFIAPTGFRGEDESASTRVVLVLGRRAGVQKVCVLGHQKIAEWPGERRAFAAGQAEHLAGVLGHALRELLAVLIADARLSQHDNSG